MKWNFWIHLKTLDTNLHLVDTVEDLFPTAAPQPPLHHRGAGAALPVHGGIPASPPRRRQRYRHLLLRQLHPGAKVGSYILVNCNVLSQFF